MTASRILNFTFLMAAERKDIRNRTGKAPNGGRGGEQDTFKMADFRAYARHTAAPPWCPTGSPGRCCP